MVCTALMLVQLVFHLYYGVLFLSNIHVRAITHAILHVDTQKQNKGTWYGKC